MQRGLLVHMANQSNCAPIHLLFQWQFHFMFVSIQVPPSRAHATLFQNIASKRTKKCRDSCCPDLVTKLFSSASPAIFNWLFMDGKTHVSNNHFQNWWFWWLFVKGNFKYSIHFSLEFNVLEKYNLTSGEPRCTLVFSWLLALLLH